MANAAVIAVDPPPLSTADYDLGLAAPPFDTAFFSQGDSQNDAVIDDLDFDFSFDDLYLPSPDELDDLLNPIQVQELGPQTEEDVNHTQRAPHMDALSRKNSLVSRHVPGEGYSFVDLSSDDTGTLYSRSPELEPIQISGLLNLQSPESNGSNHETPYNCTGDVKTMDWPSPESRGSDNCGSANFAPNLNLGSNKAADIDDKAMLEDQSMKKINGSSLKRKVGEDLPNNAPESTQCKHYNCTPENSNGSNDNTGLREEDKKTNARLIRNRESAQLSRQRKKHYVEDLEEKVKTMQSTIQDLNMKISYFMAENATLRQQMGSNVSVPPTSMYPYPSMMMYPWIPCPPLYMTKQGSQVPLVPIPKLKPKPQQSAQVPQKAAKKAEHKQGKRAQKTKKVAGISFLGLILFFMLFGCLVPFVNVRYGGVREALSDGGSYNRLFEEQNHGRVLMMNEPTCGDKCLDQRSGDNETKPFVASLYVPRNDKLVKIDGNLIIHSVLASERAVSSDRDATALAVQGSLGPTVRVPTMKINGGGHPEVRALGSGWADSVMAADGNIQQWFQEGIAGPMLSSGMCTEIFQFHTSAASSSGATVPSPAAATRNVTQGHDCNSTHLGRVRNRRILHSLPIPHSESTGNITKQHMEKNPHKDRLNADSTASPMVVSVLVDPREATGDADVDGVGKAKSFSRIFVVVLVDSVKYVTYSCVLPFKGSTHHLG